MMLTLYQIDAFAEQAFEGNPAAVIPLQDWLPDATMQAIAEENNLAETAFFVPRGGGYHIRWFTPAAEVKLCGHATLASAFVLFNMLGFEGESIDFDSLSGTLFVTRSADLLTLNFPSQNPTPCDAPEALIMGLGKTPLECLAKEDYVAVFASEQDIVDIKPDHSLLAKLDLRGIIVTALGAEFDFVARFFAPTLNVPEDPVTGSAYTHLTPFWSARLGKTKLTARQVSARGGNLICELADDRVLISGSAVKYMEGVIEIDV